MILIGHSKPNNPAAENLFLIRLSQSTRKSSFDLSSCLGRRSFDHLSPVQDLFNTNLCDDNQWIDNLIDLVGCISVHNGGGYALAPPPFLKMNTYI